MNICVVGAGAIGGWVAARLALAGEHGDGADQPRRRSIAIELSEGGETETAALARFDGPRRHR